MVIKITLIKIFISTFFVLVNILLISKFILAQNLLNNPESIVYDAPRDRYLVSNWGDGTIVEIKNDSSQSYFSTEYMNIFQLAGIYIFGDTLLCAAGNAAGAGIAAFDITTSELLFHIPLPGIGLPNDIVVDNLDNIYVTDYWGDKIYKISNHIPSVMIQEGILDWPNGMYYDELENRLLLLSVSGAGSPILGVSLLDSSVSTIVVTGFLGTDGITRDAEGNFYISEWTNDRIYKYDQSFSNPPVVFSEGNYDPADIYYNDVHDLIAIPNFGSNEVRFIAINPVSVKHGSKDSKGGKFLLRQNFPNPFNSKTIIPFYIKESSLASLKIFSLLGNEITVLFNEEKYSGEYTIPFDAGDLPSGLYFYSLESGNYIKIRKMCLIK